MSKPSSPEHVQCPICHGTTRYHPQGFALVSARKYPDSYKYNPEDETCECYNCGRQYPFGKPTGFVPKALDGSPCKHVYVETNAGRCYTRYTCKNCKDEYFVDSSD